MSTNGPDGRGNLKPDGHSVWEVEEADLVDDQLDAAKRWVVEVQAAYADGGYAAGDGPAPPLDEMEWLIAEVERLRGGSNGAS